MDANHTALCGAGPYEYVIAATPDTALVVADKLAAGSLPRSYRFLSNAISAWDAYPRPARERYHVFAVDMKTRGVARIT